MAALLADEFNVSWFEEPRPSNDLKGLRLLRNRGPAGMDIAAGEYGDTVGYFRQMLEAGAVDCLQADATRCGGYTGFLKVAALCEAFHMPLSAHWRRSCMRMSVALRKRFDMSSIFTITIASIESFSTGQSIRLEESFVRIGRVQVTDCP